MRQSMKVLDRMIRPRIANLTKSANTSEQPISRVSIHDNVDDFIKDAQDKQPTLQTEYLQARLNDHKLTQMELLNEANSEHLFYLDQSKIKSQDFYVENPTKSVTSPSAKSIIGAAKGVKQKDLEVSLNISNESVTWSLLDQLNYHNFELDYKKCPLSSDLESGENIFGNKVILDNLFITSGAYDQDKLNELMIINEAQTLTRNLVNLRADLCTPGFFASNVRAFAEENNLEYEVLEGQELLEKNLNMLHAVGRCASSPPALAIVHYQGNPEDLDDKYSYISYQLIKNCFV